MTQQAMWWQRYGTLAQMARATVALLGAAAILLQINETASVAPPDCKLGKT